MAYENLIHEPEAQLVEKALAALREQTGISGKLIALQANQSPDYTADAVIEIIFGQQPQRYIVECKARADRKSVISNVGMTLSRLSAPGLLIAPYISREIAEFCRSINLQFIDTHGNAYLNAPGMLVHIKGQKDVAATTTPGQGRASANPAALRVAFVLLSQPMMVRGTYRDIKTSAGVSLGSVNSTFTDLRKRGLLLDPDNASHRKLLEPARLLEEWIINYPIVLRPQLTSKRFSAPDPSWWQKVDLAELNAVWGGEVAAERLTGYLKPASQTLYVEPGALNDCVKKLVSTYRLRSDPRGSIEILEKFWHFPPNPAHPDIAPPILVYADLMATYDPRNREAATMLRESIHENADH
jgi:hypothetical protein